MRETAKPYMVRLYQRHRTIIKRSSKKLHVTDAEAVRRALEAFTPTV
jgi:hypothetical protein